MSEENKVGFELEVETRSAQENLKEFYKVLDQYTNILVNMVTNSKPINNVTRMIERLGNISTKRAQDNLKALNQIMRDIDSSFNTDIFKLLSGQISTMDLAVKSFLKTASRFNKTDMSGMENFNLNPIIKQLDLIKNADVSALDKFKSLSSSVNEITSGMKRLNDMEISTATNNGLTAKMSKITEMVAQFTTAFENVKTDGVSAIVKALTELPKAMQAMEKLDHSKVGQSFDTLTQKLHKFLAELRESSSEIHAFSNIVSTLGKGANTNPLTSGLRNVQREIKNTGTESDKANRKLSNMLSFGKVYAFYNQLRHYGTGFANMLNKAIDFTEIENYFSRAMGNMRSEAMKFQNQLSDMYGLAMPSMMQAQATFKNQLGALGDLSEDMSYMLSERLTKMSLDYASLYNVSVDSAVTKFQAALSKQVRPIRSQSGYDITQSVLGGTLENIGIYDRQIRDLSEVEKRLTIILTLQQQMARSAAMGDFARTIEQPANQLKILQQQIAEVGRWISAVFYGVIGKVLPYINGFVMAIKSLIQMFATFLGYELPDSSGSTGSILDSMDDSLGGVSDGLDDVNSGLDDANSGLDSAKKKTKEWKNFLAGFDVANVIPDQSTDDSSSGSGGGGSSSAGGMSIDSRLLKALQDMDYIFDNIRMKAMDIRDRLLEWANILGEVVDDNIFEPIRNSWNKYGAGILQNITETRDNIVHILGGVFDVVAKKWKPFFQAASDLFFSLLDTASLVTDTISTFFRHVWDSGGKYLFEALWDLATAFLKLATSVNDNFVKPVLNWFKRSIAPAFGDLVGTILKGVGKIVKGFANVITWIAKCKPVVLTLSSLLAAMFVVVKTAKFITWIQNIKKTIEIYGGLKAAIKAATLKLIDGSEKIGAFKGAYKILNELIGNTRVWSNIGTKVMEFGTNLVNSGTSAGGLVGILKGKLGSALTWLATNPAALAIGAIAALITGIALLGATQKEKKYEMDDYSEAVQNQIKVVDDLNKSLEDAKSSYDDAMQSAQAQVQIAEDAFEKLQKLSGNTGIIDPSKTKEAEEEISNLNKSLGETVVELKNGMLVYKDGDKVVKNGTKLIEERIAKLKKQAEEEAKYQLYVEYTKAKIKADAEYDAAYTQYNENQTRLEEIKAERTKIAKDKTEGYGEALEKLAEEERNLQADQDGLNKALGKAEKASKKAEKSVRSLDKSMDNMGDSSSELSDKMADYYKSFNLSDKAGKEFESLAKKMKATNKVMESCMKDGKVVNQKEYEDTKKTREKLVKEYAEKAKKYKLSSKDIIEIAKKNGVNLSKEELEQAKESLKKAEQSKKDVTRVKNQQNKELLTLLDKLGIDKDSKLGKQYQVELEKAQKNGTKSGEDHIKNMKKGISSGDISPDAQAQWNKGQKIFDNPLTALAKVMGASDAGKGAYGTLVSWIVKTFTGTVTTSGAGTAGSKAAGDIKGKIKNLPGSINKTMGGLSSAWSYVKSWFSGKAVTVSVDFVAGKVAANIKGALKITTGWFADGGFPDVGQMFIAREAGPELVGTMGGRTAVANNDQITSGIYRAVLQALRDGGGFQERGGDLYITIQNEDGSKTMKIIKDYKKQMIFSGGKGGVPV